jgi:hypothetical protein
MNTQARISFTKAPVRGGGWPLAWGAAICWLALLGLLISGCQTTPKINWETRVGTYSYDAAVVELGPPDKSAKLSDNTLVCEWLTYHGGHQGGAVLIPGFYPQYWSDNGSPDRFLRLTFTAEGKLKEWKKVVR